MKKVGLGVGLAQRGEGTKIAAIALGDSLPISSVGTALPHASQLVEEVLGNSFLDEFPAEAKHS